MHDTSHGSGRLGRIAVIVAVLAGIATIVGVAWTIFNRPSTAIADYRQEAVTTCVQMRSIVNQGFPADAVTISPRGLIVSNKRRFVDAMTNRVGLIRTAFSHLNDRPFPPELTAERERVLAAQDGWSVAAERNIELVRQELQRGDAVALASEMTERAGYPLATVNPR